MLPTSKTRENQSSAQRLSRWGLVPMVVAAMSLASAIACGKDAPRTDATGSTLSAIAGRGRIVAEASGCTNCHSTDGRSNVGPTWEGAWGTTVRLDDGRSAVVDAAYIRRSIVDPRADQVADFASTMPRFSLTEDEIDAVTAYIRSLSKKDTPNG